MEKIKCRNCYSQNRQATGPNDATVFVENDAVWVPYCDACARLHPLIGARALPIVYPPEIKPEPSIEARLRRIQEVYAPGESAMGSVGMYVGELADIMAEVLAIARKGGK